MGLPTKRSSRFNSNITPKIRFKQFKINKRSLLFTASHYKYLQNTEYLEKYKVCHVILTNFGNIKEIITD